MKKTVHLIVSGKVHGVWFRWDTRQWATKFEITGWVKNLLNGNVEIMATSDNSKMLSEFIEQVEIGSPASLVDHVEINWLGEVIEFDSFTIKT
ncbi:acylphosphatase [bacterium]|nr:acylphosphatase [bacterium]MBL7052623.1 acylphosphatase [Candidatus Neomarinimicrobiota bacterium]